LYCHYISHYIRLAFYWRYCRPLRYYAIDDAIDFHTLLILILIYTYTILILRLCWYWLFISCLFSLYTLRDFHSHCRCHCWYCRFSSTVSCHFHAIAAAGHIASYTHGQLLIIAFAGWLAGHMLGQPLIALIWYANIDCHWCQADIDITDSHCLSMPTYAIDIILSRAQMPPTLVWYACWCCYILPALLILCHTLFRARLATLYARHHAIGYCCCCLFRVAGCHYIQLFIVDIAISMPLMLAIAMPYCCHAAIVAFAIRCHIDVLMPHYCIAAAITLPLRWYAVASWFSIAFIVLILMIIFRFSLILIIARSPLLYCYAMAIGFRSLILLLVTQDYVVLMLFAFLAITLDTGWDTFIEYWYITLILILPLLRILPLSPLISHMIRYWLRHWCHYSQLSPLVDGLDYYAPHWSILATWPLSLILIFIDFFVLLFRCWLLATRFSLIFRRHTMAATQMLRPLITDVFAAAG